MDESLLQAFAVGLSVGLLISLYTWGKGWLKQRELRGELRKLKEHLQSHMELSHEGTTQRKEELEELRRQNENLRITVKTWQQKPGRRELRTLHVYDHAARELMKNAPGFAGHWETALQNAEEILALEDRGVMAFARRLVLPRTRTRGELKETSGEAGTSEEDHES